MTDITVIVEKSKDSFWSRIEDLPGCFACVSNKVDIIEETKTAIKLHLESLILDGDEIPEKFKGKYSLTFKEK